MRTEIKRWRIHLIAASCTLSWVKSETLTLLIIQEVYSVLFVWSIIFLSHITICTMCRVFTFITFFSNFYLVLKPSRNQILYQSFHHNPHQHFHHHQSSCLRLFQCLSHHVCGGKAFLYTSIQSYICQTRNYETCIPALHKDISCYCSAWLRLG